ncbi:MAG: RDD family protein [Nocardioides sp.]|jgi:hypothetical protein
MSLLAKRTFARWLDLALVVTGADLITDQMFRPLTTAEYFAGRGVDLRWVATLVALGLLVDVLPLPFLGASPGKLLLGLKVSSSGVPLSGFDGLVVALWRWAIWFGPFVVAAFAGVPTPHLFLLFPALMTLSSPEEPRRGPQDRLSGTSVVQVRRGTDTTAESAGPG